MLSVGQFKDVYASGGGLVGPSSVRYDLAFLLVALVTVYWVRSGKAFAFTNRICYLATVILSFGTLVKPSGLRYNPTFSLVTWAMAGLPSRCISVSVHLIYISVHFTMKRKST